jgi:hypothetical protein
MFVEGSRTPQISAKLSAINWSPSPNPRSVFLDMHDRFEACSSHIAVLLVSRTLSI